MHAPCGCRHTMHACRAPEGRGAQEHTAAGVICCGSPDTLNAPNTTVSELNYQIKYCTVRTALHCMAYYFL